MANSKYLKIDELYSNEDIKYIKTLSYIRKSRVQSTHMIAFLIKLLI